LPLAAAAGVVGMRDMGGALDAVPELRRLASEPGMPRILASGPILTGEVDDPDHRIWKLPGPDSVPAALDRLIAARVDHVKVHDWLTRDTWRRTLDAARGRGAAVVGHLPVQIDAREAAGRQKSIEHLGNAWGGLLLDVSSQEASLKRQVRAHMRQSKGPQDLSEHFTATLWQRIAESQSHEKTVALATALARGGTFVCPTMYTFAWLQSRDIDASMRADPRLAYLPEDRRGMLASMTSEGTLDGAARRSRAAVLQARRQIVRTLHDHGVTLLAGTDYAQYPLVFPGFSLHDELAQLVEAGLSPAAALRAATANVGRYLDDRTVGCLDVGCRADAVFLEANPLENIRHVARVQSVLTQGHYLDARAREQRLDDVRRRFTAR
jgi:Amidohydrolase family